MKNVSSLSIFTFQNLSNDILETQFGPTLLFSFLLFEISYSQNEKTI
jgi:hypothetical protein